MNDTLEKAVRESSLEGIKEGTRGAAARDILAEAHTCIHGERQDRYGCPEDSFRMIASYWQTYLEDRLGMIDPLNAQDVAIMMTLFKIARMSGQAPHRDNPRDAIGYLAILADRLM